MGGAGFAFLELAASCLDVGEGLEDDHKLFECDRGVVISTGEILPSCHFVTSF